MAKKTYSNEELRDLVECGSDSLDYLVQQYLDAERIEDPETSALWKAAADALEALEKRLGVGE